MTVLGFSSREFLFLSRPHSLSLGGLLSSLVILLVHPLQATMRLEPSSVTSSDDGQLPGFIMASVCAVGTIMIFIVAAAFRYMKTQRKADPESHLTLSLKRTSDHSLPLNLRKPSAVRSPGSQVGAGVTLKKSPSPSDHKSPPGSCDISEHLGAGSTGTNSRSSSHHSFTSDQLVVQEKKIQNEDSNEGDPEEVLGKLFFKLKYSYESSSLCVTIQNAEIEPSPTRNVIDPYIKLQLLPDKQHKVKTRVMKKTLNPVFDEDFTFYGIDPSELKKVSLHFTLLSFDRFSRDLVIGEVVFHVDHLEFDCLDKIFNLSRNILPRQSVKEERGELLVSICYQPPASRLAIVVLKARNLPKMDMTGYCDPYVKIYLMDGNQRIAKKKTHVKKRTLNPVFNESFIFEIPSDRNISDLSLEFVLLDYERVTKNEVVGNLIIGQRSDGSAGKHWQDIQMKPRRQIAEWHKLRKAD